MERTWGGGFFRAPVAQTSKPTRNVRSVWWTPARMHRIALKQHTAVTSVQPGRRSFPLQLSPRTKKKKLCGKMLSQLLYNIALLIKSTTFAGTDIYTSLIYVQVCLLCFRLARPTYKGRLHPARGPHSHTGCGRARTGHGMMRRELTSFKPSMPMAARRSLLDWAGGGRLA